MKKEIGSIFPLSDAALQKAESRQSPLSGDRLYYSLCREALADIAVSVPVASKKVLIPAYTCQSVVTPFEEAGWQCAFFAVRKDLRIDTTGLLEAVKQHHPSVIIAHPYYGMDLNDDEMQALEMIHEMGVIVVMDLTQCLFSIRSYPFATFVTASYRKWIAIPDGGYLINKSDIVRIKQPTAENSGFTGREKDAMYLRGQYFENGEQRLKDISIRLSKSADAFAEQRITPHRMSQVSYNLLKNEDLTENQNKRLANYAFLFRNIKKSGQVHKICLDMNDVTTAPLYFPIYVEDRQNLQQRLAQDSIYAPVLWPMENEHMLINGDTKYIYDHILVIPCDQRYDEEDLQRAVEIINHY